MFEDLSREVFGAWPLRKDRCHGRGCLYHYFALSGCQRQWLIAADIICSYEEEAPEIGLQYGCIEIGVIEGRIDGVLCSSLIWT